MKRGVSTDHFEFTGDERFANGDCNAPVTMIAVVVPIVAGNNAAWPHLTHEDGKLFGRILIEMG